MPYVQFVNQRPRRPNLIIKANGKFHLSTPATRLLREAGAQRLVILWDHEKRMIALQVAQKDDTNAHSISYRRNDTSADFCDTAFLRRIAGTRERANVHVPLEWNQAEQMLEGKVPD